MNKTKPYLNICIGDFIKEELEVRNWSEEMFADIVGLSIITVRKLLNSEQIITNEIAKILSSVFGQSTQYWINLSKGVKR